MQKLTHSKLKNNSYIKDPIPYSWRVGPEFPNSSGISVLPTNKGYFSLWQSKGFTQNLKFPAHYE